MEALLKSRLTPLQTTKLDKIGIRSMYDLITTFPFKLEQIQPYPTSQVNPNQKYILNGFIQRFEIVNRGRKYLKIEISGEFSLQLYLFNTAPYILKLLHTESEFQFIISNKNNFLSIEKMAIKNGLVGSGFVLGKAQIKSHIVPKYLRNLAVTDTTFKSIHSRLLPENYILNLAGLIPENNQLIPQKINLFDIHHPSDTDIYFKTLQQYTTLKVFLRKTVLKRIELISKEKYGTLTKLDQGYLKQLSEGLPYTLSMTQKNTIWDILGDLSV